MTQARQRQLKVFQVHLGFFDTVVAAPSQAAALRAWGTRQNLFADGQARVTDDPQAIAAALAHPEIPLKRAVGSSDPFARESLHLPKLPDAPRPDGARSKRKAAAQAPPRPAADRSALDAAEAALRALDQDRTEEEATFRRRQDDLDGERKSAQAAYVDRHKAAAQALVDARTAYRKAGGTA